MTAYRWRSGVGGDWASGTLWAGGLVPNATDASVTIAAPGTYIVTIAGGETFAAGTLALNDPGVVLSDSGLLHVTGTLTVQAGRVALHRGTIQGGTIVGDGTELVFGQEPLNTLDGVTVQGGLALNGNAVFTHGTKVVAANGTSPGALTLGSVQGSILQIVGAQTLHNAIQMKNFSQIVASSADALPDTLTFAVDARVSGDGFISVDTPGTLVNDGTITADQAGQRLDLFGAAITNSGILASINDAILSVDGPLTNTGAVTATGGTLQISALHDNRAGTITTTNAEVDIGDIVTATLGHFHRTGGRLLVTGTVDNSHQNLDLTHGRLGGLTLGGTIQGGTVTNPGGLQLVYQYSALLDGVTVLGNLTVHGGGLRLAGTAVRTADGTAPGIITVNGQALILQGTQTFHGTVQLSAGATLDAGAYAVGALPGSDTLTLAGDAQIAGAGKIGDALFLGEAGGQGLFIGPATIVNAGSVTGTVAGQSLIIAPNSFTNTGGLGSVTGATLTVAPTYLTNLAHGTLDRGYYGSGGVMQLKSNGVLTTIGGAERTDVQLDRQGQLSSWDPSKAAYAALQDTLTTIGVHGNLSLSADTSFSHALVNDGTLTQYDGEHTIKTQHLTNALGGRVLLWGTLVAPLSNDGVVQATGDSKITGAVTGTGELDLLTVSTLELAQIGSQTIKFIGASATLTLDTPGTYTGQIDGFTRRDTINLAGVQASRAQYADGVLTLYNEATAVARLHVTGPFPNEIFEVKPDGIGGVMVKLNDIPVTTAPVAETVIAGMTTALPGISVADADARFPDETFTVLISDMAGLLIATAGNGQAAITGAHTKALSVTGGLFDVNAALATLTYTAGGAGSDLLHSLTSDGRGGMASHSIGVTITPPHLA